MNKITIFIEGIGGVGSERAASPSGGRRLGHYHLGLDWAPSKSVSNYTQRSFGFLTPGWAIPV